MRCIKCGNEFEGRFCPKCGTPVQASAAQNVPPTNVRKKKNGCLVIFLVALVIVAAFVIIIVLIGIINGTKQALNQPRASATIESVVTATSGTSSTEVVKQTEITANATITVAASPTPAPSPTAIDKDKPNVIIGEVAQINGFALQVTKIEKTQGTKYDRPKSGKEFVVVYLSIKNVGLDTFSYNPYYFKMKNSEGQITDATFTINDTDTKLNSGELVPGGVVSGTVAFEQPKDDPALVFVYEDTSWFSDKSINVDLMKTAPDIVPLQQEAVSIQNEQIVAVGEENKLDDAVVTVNTFKKATKSKYSKPKDGMEFVIVEVTITNNGSETLSYNPYDFKMRNSKGQVVDMDLGASLDDTTLESGELAGGGKVTGTLIFEQPVNDQSLVLIYQPNYFSSQYMAFAIK